MQKLFATVPCLAVRPLPESLLRYLLFTGARGKAQALWESARSGKTEFAAIVFITGLQKIFLVEHNLVADIAWAVLAGPALLAEAWRTMQDGNRGR